MTKIEMVRFTSEYFSKWVVSEKDELIQTFTKCGLWTHEEAPTRVENLFAKFLPDGLNTRSHRLFQLQVDGADVGMIWFGERPNELPGLVWLCKIQIDDAHRRKGYARKALTMMEEMAKTSGYSAIGLNVFDSNSDARNLYESMGYVLMKKAEKSSFLKKDL